MKTQLRNLLNIHAVQKTIELNIGRLTDKLNTLYRMEDLTIVNDDQDDSLERHMQNAESCYQETVNSIKEILNLGADVYVVTTEIDFLPTVVVGSVIVNSIPYVCINETYIALDRVNIDDVKQHLQKLL